MGNVLKFLRVNRMFVQVMPPAEPANTLRNTGRDGSNLLWRVPFSFPYFIRPTDPVNTEAENSQ